MTQKQKYCHDNTVKILGFGRLEISASIKCGETQRNMSLVTSNGTHADVLIAMLSLSVEKKQPVSGYVFVCSMALCGFLSLCHPKANHGLSYMNT